MSTLRSRAGPDVVCTLTSSLVGDDAGERRLAEPRRTGEQDMVERVSAVASRLHEDLKLLLDGRLAHEVVEALGAQ